MRVMLLKDEPRFKIKKGEEFEAKRHEFNREKWSLEFRISDNYDPRCYEYNHNLAFWLQGKWQVIGSDGAFTPMKEADTVSIKNTNGTITSVVLLAD